MSALVLGWCKCALTLTGSLGLEVSVEAGEIERGGGRRGHGQDGQQRGDQPRHVRRGGSGEVSGAWIALLL